MANNNEIKINVPEGMEIDRENSTFECIKFKKRGPALNFKQGDWIYVKSNTGFEYLGMFDRREIEECSTKDKRDVLYVDYMIDADYYLCIDNTIPLIRVDSIDVVREVSDREMEQIIVVLNTNGYDWDDTTRTVIKKSVLPKTWEEFCKVYPLREKEYYIDNTSNICEAYNCGTIRRNSIVDKNLLPDKETTEAILALLQLIQLRDCYNDGWEPNWEDNTAKYVIYTYYGNINTDVVFSTNRILVFKTAELRDKFLENFRDLIEIAKPLI